MESLMRLLGLFLSFAVRHPRGFLLLCLAVMLSGQFYLLPPLMVYATAAVFFAFVGWVRRAFKTAVPTAPDAVMPHPTAAAQPAPARHAVRGANRTVYAKSAVMVPMPRSTSAK